MMDSLDTLDDVLARRYSCRAFLQDPVPEEVLRKIIKAAGRAPSWCNAQPWKVTLTRGDATEDFREALQAAIRNKTIDPDDGARSEV